jgi:hypothetical protein
MNYLFIGVNNNLLKEIDNVVGKFFVSKEVKVVRTYWDEEFPELTKKDNVFLDSGSALNLDYLKNASKVYHVAFGSSCHIANSMKIEGCYRVVEETGDSSWM